MEGDSANLQSDVDNPFLPPQVRSTLPLHGAAVELKISIADVLFLMFAVALALTVEYQRWGGFGSTNPAHIINAFLSALAASVFFTANRLRRQNKIPFSESQPGYNVALVCAGLLFANVFQYLVSFLDVRHVGAPIHILALLSPMLYTIAVCSAVLYKCKLTPRWQAYFLVTAVYALLRLAAITCAEFASPSDLEDPYRIAASYFFRFSAAAWSLSTIFLLCAYVLDFFTRESRDWLHHQGALLGLAASTALAIEEPVLTQLYWYLHYNVLWSYL